MWDDDPDAPDNAKKLNAEYKHTYQTHDFTLSLNPTEGLLFIDDDIQDEEWGGQWETHLGEKEGC
ncbi:hypothetical protein C483_17788 [Natrialba hulunbeirensis JCM 10989]|uniref:Uncharacterized protein n=2 Tax=Natrialba hulunbeirensis TaxID=123783 RepID=L9ZRJ3_9EURY|nr:hypothetical protein C483_17788 [Natrialba hulunbeirensis JCM 10989]